MKIWHDDIRRPPDDTWTWARTNEAAIALLEANSVVEISMDNDLGLHDLDPDAELAIYQAGPLDEGWKLAVWMVANGKVPETVRVHSLNNVRAKYITDYLNDHGYDAILDPFKPPTSRKEV